MASKGQKSHRDVEFAVNDASGEERIFKTWDEAAGFALVIAMGRGESSLDVLVYSEEGARWAQGDEGVDQYREDPDASVFERYEIKVNAVGRVA
jgi:hypothetical protein